MIIRSPLLHMLRGRPEAVKLVLSDVDGVLTDGRLTIDDHGVETKTFHVLDGSAIANLRHVGIDVGWITGRRSRAVLWRARDCGLSESLVFQGTHDKLSVVQRVATERQLGLHEIAYIGDDFLDLKALLAVGFACVPADARPEVVAVAHFVTPATGGNGVLRDVADYLIRAQGRWDELMKRYLP